jgi:arylamine N-acetyltransferase
MTDHLALGTGGTCFSLTELLRVLVSAAGLSCHPVMAHMRHGANIHCALRVEACGRAFLVDPGYLLPRPLELGRAAPAEPEAGHPIIVPAGTHEGVPEGVPAGDFDLFTCEPSGLKWRYRFSDRAPTEEAFMERWLQSFALPGMRSLVATRRAPDSTRLYLHNHKLRQQGPAQKSTRNVRATLADTVEQTFGIHPDVTRRARAILDRRKEAWRNNGQ